MNESTLKYGPFTALAEKAPPLHVPSVNDGFIDGPALRHSLYLPLRTMTGSEVFSKEMIRWLAELFNKVFHGSTQFASKPVPPIIGAWAGQRGIEYERVNIYTVYSRFDEEGTEEFFRQVGTILRTVGDQDDILIERVAVDLLNCRNEDESE